MLKLLKYEFRACAGQLVVLYIMVLALAVAMRLSFTADRLQWLFSGAFSAACTATAAVTLFVVIKRFTGHVLGDEGYLTMTLPVSAFQIVLTKLICAVLFVGIGLLVGVLAISILVGRSFLPGVSEMRPWIQAMRPGDWWLLARILLTAILELSSQILLIYLAACLSGLCNDAAKRKLIFTGAFIVLFVLNLRLAALVSNCFMNPSGLWQAALSDTVLFRGVSGWFTLQTIYSAVVCGVLFLLVSYMLKNKLNLL